MSEELSKQLRDAAMDTFREWGGQWNVSTLPPGTDAVPEDAWLIKVKSNPIVKGLVKTATITAYLESPDDPDAKAAWEAELRPLFDDARAQAP